MLKMFQYLGPKFVPTGQNVSRPPIWILLEWIRHLFKLLRKENSVLNVWNYSVLENKVQRRNTMYCDASQ